MSRNDNWRKKMSDLKPGKGGHFTAVGETLEFFSLALNDIVEAYGSEGDDEQDNGDSKKIYQRVKNSGDWEEEKDNFGSKLYREIQFGEGTYRVSFVLTKRGDLKLDVRQWYVG